MYLINFWFDIISGKKSNWEFFVNLNSGWLEMEYQHRCGNHPTDLQQWEWMFLNAERIELSVEDYDALVKKMGLMDDF